MTFGQRGIATRLGLDQSMAVVTACERRAALFILLRKAMSTRGTIRAYFKNFNGFPKHWTVKDGHTNQVVIDREFDGDEVVKAALDASDAGYGEVYYKDPDASDWTHVDLVSDDDTIDMY